jgi:hypothetical protein
MMHFWINIYKKSFIFCNIILKSQSLLRRNYCVFTKDIRKFFLAIFPYYSVSVQTATVYPIYS